MGSAPFVFSLLGHRCQVTGANHEEARWLQKHWQFGHHMRSLQPLRITMHFSQDAPPAAVRAGAYPCRTRLHNTALVWQQLGSRWWRTATRDVGVELRLHAHAAFILVWRRAGATTSFPVETALQVAMCEALRTAGLAPLHAAVIARHGQATALIGKSGMGKSTSLLLAMAQGWQPVAEDFSWFDPASARVYGWDRGVRLTQEAIAWIRPNWQADGWQRDHGEKLFLNYDKLTSVRPADGQLTRVALLQRDATRPSGWERLGLSESVRALCESVGVPLCRENRNYFADQVAQLLSRLELVRLIVGNTPLPL